MLHHNAMSSFHSQGVLIHLEGFLFGVRNNLFLLGSVAYEGVFIKKMHLHCCVCILVLINLYTQSFCLRSFNFWNWFICIDHTKFDIHYKWFRMACLLGVTRSIPTILWLYFHCLDKSWFLLISENYIYTMSFSSKKFHLWNRLL